jgi:alpha-L-rhamnosidase
MNGESQKILSGNLEAWLYQTLGGINYDPERPGFRHIILRPRPVGDLSFVHAEHASLYGPIVSRWKLDGGAFLWHVSIPPNTIATVYVPGKNASTVTEGANPADQAQGVKLVRVEGNAVLYEIGSGNYFFQSRMGRVGKDGKTPAARATQKD